jgi:signal transduction histidine kinase
LLIEESRAIVGIQSAAKIPDLEFVPADSSRLILRLKVLSDDSQVHRLCKEILTDFPALRGVESDVNSDDAGGPPTIVVYDYQPGAPLPDSLTAEDQRVLFLVDKNDLVDFYQMPGAQSAAVLLKPATRSTLAALLAVASSPGGAWGMSATSGNPDRKNILQCLIQTNLTLQEYDRGRTNFLARALHDFEAPVTALCGYCDFLLSEAAGPLTDTQKEVVDRMLRSSIRLSRTSASIHRLSAEGPGRAWRALRRGDIRESVERAVQDVTPFAAEKRITVSVEVAEPGGILRFDPAGIEQALINLLENACRFTAKGGRIAIRGYPYAKAPVAAAAMAAGSARPQAATADPDSYRIDVCDSGAVIPPEQMALIFDGHAPANGSPGRICRGLALAVCRTVVLQHHGSIWAENTDSGPTLSFALPYHFCEPGDDPAQENSLSEVS